MWWRPAGAADRPTATTKPLHLHPTLAIAIRCNFATRRPLHPLSSAWSCASRSGATSNELPGIVQALSTCLPFAPGKQLSCSPCFVLLTSASAKPRAALHTLSLHGLQMVFSAGVSNCRMRYTVCHRHRPLAYVCWVHSACALNAAMPCACLVCHPRNVGITHPRLNLRCFLLTQEPYSNAATSEAAAATCVDPTGVGDSGGSCNTLLTPRRCAIYKTRSRHSSTPLAACMCRDGAAAGNLQILHYHVTHSAWVGGALVGH